LVRSTKVYPGVGADIVMESITLIDFGFRRTNGASLWKCLYSPMTMEVALNLA